MQLRWLVLALVVAGMLSTGAIASRAGKEVPATLTGRITAVVDEDEVLLEANNQRYKLDLPDACKPALRNGVLRVGGVVTASGKLELDDRELDVSVVQMNGRRVCP
ncbi:MULTISPECIES: hypothetical protein [unclassified Thermosynechococcus]|uniref:hypothetical protein n=1 Tax=unclassified Thermosynechococcus TaxID=2622553 RepID=UPI002872E06D|nr:MULTISPECIES: hypothetical protein [unclassified Thermosynechococcus]WNC31439.1 hypothetical protein RHH81_07245 [Thermosynechococcus sp. PKX95]WNC33963.1 hypothetical protein RHH79_07240 [Thermosynechococcus sp. PKX91]WNC36487.1 hypothetical protein RHI11_07245 [Thermosynechococcus sp. WL11]WNC39008.1 hypothetical protein RHI18_07245 [Thermosynechococcus sp. WL17]WNC41530.1 hypothetical protein RHI14_07240 [Thermosynechococcus sp. WL15]